MNEFKKEKLFNHPTYDKRSDELIIEIYTLVRELSQFIRNGDYSSVCLANAALCLFEDASWRVRNGKEGTVSISSLRDIELVMGYYFAPEDDPDPESYFFRIEPDIMRTQVCQIFLRLVASMEDDLKNQKKDSP